MEVLLGVKRGSWREQELHEDKAYLDARSKALARDEYKCRVCGLQADKYQEAHHADDDHTNNDVSNIVTHCMWCHRCHHIGLAGQFELGYVGISTNRDHPLPPQGQINQYTRMYDWIAAHGRQNIPAHYIQWAYTFEEYLVHCIAAAERVFGSAELSDFAEILTTLDDNEYAKRGEMFSGVRLIHRRMEDLNEGANDFEKRELERRKYWVGLLKQRLGSPK
ncbi:MULTISPECIES: HNH endonuclease signature motif containing protein [Pseudomonas]|uniref:Type IV secretion system protein IcmJ/DotN n=2 Tax=Pseudomonas TaxID=286 RepID=A0A2X2CDW9_PSELU|nr:MULTISPECIES: HNH endonuclease [Pseudomonas]MCG7374328.1 HNH endonuclease [Pseudomonas luteola]SER21730.1 intracellular multiplication protein IcmJ [Pseudomonas lutea]SPZ04931.1 Putative type IV secretion system protein IcmJ/DotN [Pseudomonas luteola]